MRHMIVLPQRGDALPDIAGCHAWATQRRSRPAQKRYGAILIDPPWSFQVWSKDTGQGRSAEAHYPTMTLDELKALPLPSLMADDCAVFMWATWPTLLDAIALGQAWGLTYKTCAFNWVKLNKMQTDQPFTGMGYWTRANSEPCLLFTKGSPRRKDKSVQQIILEWVGGFFDGFETETIATPIQAHSQKPNAVYTRVEALVDGPYVEIFARRPYPGWDRWGNEVESTVALAVAA
jgi:N6-adenosine-specific RNA methylase IME4